MSPVTLILSAILLICAVSFLAPVLDDRPTMLTIAVVGSLLWSAFVLWWVCRSIPDHKDDDDGRDR